MTRYLVTGATGLLGMELVPRLLARAGRSRDVEVCILVRAASRVSRAAELAELALAASQHGATLRVIEGDVSEPGLDLSFADREALAIASLDHVVHAAALYELRASEGELERANVEGTRNLLALLAAERFGGVLHHVSSIAVSGDFEGRFLEEMLDAKQGFPTAYHRTKHASEKLVRSAAGLRVRVYRPGAIVGHSETGAIDRIDGPYYLFRIVHAMRDALPRWVTLPGWKAGRVAMVPVDFVAAAIDAIAHRSGLDGQTFHIVDPSPPSFRATWNAVADAAAAPRMGSFRLDRLADWLPGGRNVVGQLGGIRFLRADYLETLGVPPIVGELSRLRTEHDATNMLAALEGTGITCPRQEEYVERLWDYYARHLDPARDPEARDRRALAGQVVLITGASSGIGESMARYCGRLGSTVVLVARREAELAKIAREITDAGGAASYVVADLADYDSCDRTVRTTIERHGRIDVLVNNAGRSIRRPLSESLDRFHDLERVMQINFFGPARLIRGVLPGMQARKRGTIVNVLTAGAGMASPRFGAYTSSKAALGQLGDTLAAEHLHDGIRVVNAYLGWVRTPMMDATGKYEETDAMGPDEAARWIIAGIVNREQHLTTSDVRRRFVLARLRPETVNRVLNVLYRIYADDPDAHPELALDRAILGRFVKGRLM